jgi:hypothetical protein
MSGVILFMFLAVIGGVFSLVGSIWLVVFAFNTEQRWGWILLSPLFASIGLSVLGALLPPLLFLSLPLSLLSVGLTITYVVKTWPKSKTPFLLMASGWVIALGSVGGTFFAGAQAISEQMQIAVDVRGVRFEDGTEWGAP